MFRTGARMTFVLRPLDMLADMVPALEPGVVIIEMFMFLWLLYQAMIILEVLAHVIRRLCQPAILIGRVFGLAFR